MQDKKNTQTQSVAQTKKASLYYASAAFRCPHCGASVAAHSELCPVCMHPLHTDVCTFCGAALMSGDKFCAECGNATQGIECKKCGTINFRNFCYKCHEPLTSQAFFEVEKAKADPRFQKMKDVARSLAGLEKILLKTENDTEQNELSAEDKALLLYYQNLTIYLNEAENEQKKEEKTAKKEIEPIQNLSSKQILTQYKQKVKEMDELLKEFVPAPDASPQMQRDYYSARKIPVIFTTKQRVKGWVCNYCGCFHNVPEECVEPWLGGTWKYEEINVQEEKWVTEN